MKVAKCFFCGESVKYITDPVRLDGLGQWKHQADGARKCCDGKQIALPRSGTVKRDIEDVQTKGGRV